MPSMWTWGSRSHPVAQGYSPVHTNSDVDEIDAIEETLVDDDEAEFSLNSDNNSRGTTYNYRTQAHIFSRIPIKKIAVFCLTNVFVSICVLIFGIGVSVGAGVYALFVLKPGPVIDISVKAFDIPNHIASKRDDMLQLAMKDMSNHPKFKFGRRKRDAAQKFVDFTEFQDFPQQYNNLETKSNYVMSDSENSASLFNSNVFNKAAKTSEDLSSKEWFRQLYDYNTNAQETFLSSNFNNLHKNRRRLERSAAPRHYNSYRRWTLTLVYLTKGSEDADNIFTEKRLQQIHEIENNVVMKHPDFRTFCYKNRRIKDKFLLQYNGGCMPPNSLLTYFYPSQNEGKIYYDGLGTQQHDIEDALNLAMSKSSFYWYVDAGMNETNQKSGLLRSEVYFGAPLPPLTGNHAGNDMTDDLRFRDFVVNLTNSIKEASKSLDEIKILYGGNTIFDYEVNTTFWNDMQLALFSAGFILLLMFILTSFSLWLTFWGMMSIFLCFPLALSMYRIIFGIRNLGILNGAAAFLIIGIGVDDVFVFVNTFRQASHCKDLGDRMVHTLFTAGKATFFTSFTTAAAFAANIASSIPALHDFGLFMALIVTSCWIMVVTIMPPALNIWYKAVSKLEFYCFRRCMSCSTFGTLSLPDDVIAFVSSASNLSESSGSETNNSSIDDDSDDVPMLLLELTTVSQDNDEPMLDMDDQWTSQTNIIEPAEEVRSLREGCNLTSKIQAIMYYYIALPVIKSRWIIVGCFIVFLVTAVGLITQLHPATRPPLLFRSESNLQLFMDLKTNLSAEGISCDVCSGLFLEIPSNGIGSGTNPSLTSPSTKFNFPGNNPTPKSTNGNFHPTTPTAPIPRRTTTKTRTTTAWSTRKPVSYPKTATQRSHGKHIPVVPTTTRPAGPIPTPESVDPNKHLCTGDKCSEVAERPNLDIGAMVFVVFGLKDINKSNVTMNHVFTDPGTLVYDDNFANQFKLTTGDIDGTSIIQLCKICKMIANNTDLVKPNTAQCLPFDPNGRVGVSFLAIKAAINRYEDCRDLPINGKSLTGSRLPFKSMAGLNEKGYLSWITFAFESTTYQGQSYFTAYEQYLKWEKLIRDIKNVLKIDPGSPLYNVFQTSQFWRKIMMEVVAVSSAIYGVVLSMIICIAAVAVFTGHILLLSITCLTILGVICTVVGIFFIAGWELGAVEAVSLSILVGTSVDYCVHLVEAYLLAGKNPPVYARESNSRLRQWRTSAAVSHIGVSILSSAVTTVIASIPLTQTNIQPFAKFGEIVAINTTVSIIYTLTACTVFLALFAPAKFQNSWKAALKAFTLTCIVIGSMVLVIYICYKAGVDIPGPSGESLFTD